MGNFFRCVRARANLRALMTQKSCAVGIRNAIPRNQLKLQADAQKATNAQTAQLTEALIAHGGPSTNAPLQLLQFKYDHSSHDDVNDFLETFDVQTAHLPAVTKLALLQQ